MKFLFLARSLMTVKKKNMVILFCCFVIAVILFNIAISISYDYFDKMAYIEKNDYYHKMIIRCVVSDYPITDDVVKKLLKTSDLECEYFMWDVVEPIPKENCPYSSKNAVPMTPEGLRHFYDLSLVTYKTEYSNFIDLQIIGEIPDRNKDYGDYIPLIAGNLSGFNIGDEIKSNYFGKQVTFKVIGKYADNTLEQLFTIRNDHLYTDVEIMYDKGLLTRPENMPIYNGAPPFVTLNGEELTFGGKSQEQGQRYRAFFAFIKPENMSFSEFSARIEYLESSRDNHLMLDMWIAYHILDVESHKDDYRWLIQAMPNFIFVFIIGTLGIIANQMISEDSRKKSFAVMRLCGAKSLTLCLLTAFCEILITIPALLVSYIVLYVIGDIAKLTLITSESIIISSVFVLALTAAMIIIQIISIISEKRRML